MQVFDLRLGEPRLSGHRPFTLNELEMQLPSQITDSPPPPKHSVNRSQIFFGGELAPKTVKRAYVGNGMAWASYSDPATPRSTLGDAHGR